MDEIETPLQDLRPAFDRLRAAHLAHIPSVGERLARLARREAAGRRATPALVAACAADFGRRAELETLGAELMVSLDEIRHARKHLRAWMRPRRTPVNFTFRPARGEIRYAPVGVVGVIAPWNYPFQLIVVPLVNALAAGNRVMLKPSESTPRVSALLANLVDEVFSTDEVVLVQGGAELSAAFSRLPFDHLLFTGSTAVGRHVMAAAAQNLTPVTLELGGKCPALIAPDYPVEHAADRIAFGKCFNGGQTCVAPDYVLVPRAKLDAFVDAYLKSLARRFPDVGRDAEFTTLINARHAERMQAWVADAQARGVVVRRHEAGLDGAPPGLALVPPTVLVDPPDEAQVMREEIFGPLLPVKPYDSHEQALAYVLGRDKPLAFYTFDRDAERTRQALDRVSAGMACVNDVLIQFGQNQFPIGGIGASGMGVYHGHAGFLTFSKAMPVMYQSRINGMKLFDTPYSALARRVVGWLTR